MSPFEVGTELWEEHTRADDTEVGCNQHVSQRHIRMILIHRGCNDIRTTSGAIVGKDRSSKSHTRQYTADNHRHEVLTLTHKFKRQSVLLFRQHVLGKHQHEVEGEDGEDGLHHKLEAKYLQRH